MVSSSEVVTASGLKYVFTNRGKGRRPRAGDLVTIQYTGSFLDGTVFATTRAPGSVPFSCTLGKDSLIKGAEEAMSLMTVGSRAIFTMPPELAYGSQGMKGIIPPDATLVFDYEIVEVKRRKLLYFLRRINLKKLRSRAARIRAYIKTKVWH